MGRVNDLRMKRDVMALITKEVVGYSGTYNGNPVGLAAANAALEELSRSGTYEHLHRLGALLARHSLAALVQQPGCSTDRAMGGT